MFKMTKLKTLNDILKKGICPDCSEKINKCKCVFKEQFITINRNELKGFCEEKLKDFRNNCFSLNFPREELILFNKYFNELKRYFK